MKGKMRKKIFAKIDLNLLANPIALYERRDKNISMRIDGPEGPMVQTTGGRLTGFDYENVVHAYHYLNEENRIEACRFLIPEFREIRRLSKGGWQDQRLVESFERQHAIIYWIGSYHDHAQGVNFPLGHFHLWEEVHFPKPKDEDRRVILTPPVEILTNLWTRYFKHLDLTGRDKLPNLLARRLYDILMKWLTYREKAYFTIRYLTHVLPLLDNNQERVKIKLSHLFDQLGEKGLIDRYKLLRPGDIDDDRLPKDKEPTIGVYRKKRGSNYINYEKMRQLEAKINREKKGDLGGVS